MSEKSIILTFNMKHEKITVVLSAIMEPFIFGLSSMGKKVVARVQCKFLVAVPQGATGGKLANPHWSSPVFIKLKWRPAGPESHRRLESNTVQPQVKVLLRHPDGRGGR